MAEKTTMSSAAPSAALARSAGAAVDEYNMTHAHRGTAIIINNKTFDAETTLGERLGTDVDATTMLEHLTSLGFSVIEKKNLKKSEMFTALRDAAAADHHDNDSFVCVILSHGDDGIVYGTDGKVKTGTLVDLFKGDRCPTLAGKPKIFLIQACRGHSLMECVMADSKEPNRSQKIPTEADILVAYSTVSGFYSWRHGKYGSYFMQAIGHALEQYGTSLDFLRLLIRASRMVAYDFESDAQGAMGGKKQVQVPQIVSTLTKDIFFLPKSGSMDTE